MLTLCLLCLTPRSFIKARDMLVSGIIDALLASGILVEKAQSSMGSTRAHRRHVASHQSSPGHIRRPRNLWILFRSDCVVELQSRLEGTGKRYHSKKFNEELAKHWNSLSKAQQEPYKALALEEAENHKRLYPDWKYQPNREKTQRGRGKGKKDSEVEIVTVAPEATIVPNSSPPFEPVFTITAPMLTFSVPDVYACASPPSHPGPVVPRVLSVQLRRWDSPAFHLQGRPSGQLQRGRRPKQHVLFFA
ncbi:hypothetical protein EDD85DRAFT_139322 [Armillaria nabsnona]|nr:hypothetical protein EDD85DRAFT_139322 [Armillaria nabsnona]